VCASFPQYSVKVSGEGRDRGNGTEIDVKVGSRQGFAARCDIQELSD